MKPDWLKNLHAGEQQRKQAAEEAALRREQEIIARHDELVEYFSSNIINRINKDIQDPYFLQKSAPYLNVTKKLFGYEVYWKIATNSSREPLSSTEPQKTISIIESDQLQADVTLRVHTETQRLGFKKIHIFHSHEIHDIAEISARF